MYQIQMVDETFLVQKEEQPNQSEFETGGPADKAGAIYRIKYAPAESSYKADELVLLHPGSYSGLFFNGEVLSVIKEHDIVGKLTEEKNSDA